MAGELLVRRLGQCRYEAVWQAMRAFTERRGPDTPDEFWLVEHPPIFTLGRAADPNHIINAGDIPVLRVDRGGQVTYHGPGQLLIYPLLDLRRLALGIRRLVSMLENSVIGLLADMNIAAHARPDAPGVYVDDKKIAALGLRVRRGCCYHGLSLNIAMDLSPFERIHPCGYQGLRVTQLGDIDKAIDFDHTGEQLSMNLARHLGYTAIKPAGAPHPDDGSGI